VSDTPELLRLAEEVRQTGQSRLLRRHDESLAILSPVPTRSRRSAVVRRTEADEAAFLASAGSWKEFDVDAFKAYVRQRRDASSRPPAGPG
jgi:hypothetical protein